VPANDCPSARRERDPQGATNARAGSTRPARKQECAAIGETLIKLEEKDQHWSASARGLISGLVMWEMVKAERERRAPLLENVRTMLCEPEAVDDEGRLIAGLRFHAVAMIASGLLTSSRLSHRCGRSHPQFPSPAPKFPLPCHGNLRANTWKHGLISAAKTRSPGRSAKVPNTFPGYREFAPGFFSPNRSSFLRPGHGEVKWR
jgi:hypothetical protein